MGFYGNITNQSKTQFQFDRTYPNRYEMEKNKTKDGIYIGRYVLIEYDIDTRETTPGTANGVDQYKTIYRKWREIKDNLGNITFSGWRYYNSTDASHLVTKSDVDKGQIVNCRTILNSGNISTSTILMRCEGFGEYDNETLQYIATFTIVTEEEDNYTRNYQIDVQEYGPGRGWDSTVWQKVYTDGTEKYVMIAELNTVVPTFTLTSDAPTTTPIMPHFDKDSTNVYYKMHYQPQWGFRIKSAQNYTGKYPLTEEGEENKEKENSSYKFSTDDILYPSDEKTTWKRYKYNKATNEQSEVYYDGERWGTSENAKVDAAIYFNKDGFDKENIVYSSDNKVEINSKWPNIDQIKIETTGQSGHEYNRHDGTAGQNVQADTQELSIMLPSIGNTIAQLWNIVYGDETLNAGRKRNLDIEWDSTDGLRAVNLLEDGYSFDTDKLETIAGVINSTHDLMGMIIQQEDDYFTQTEIDDSSLGNIYYFKNDGTFRRKKASYEYTELEYNYVQLSNDIIEPIYRPELFYILSNGEYIKDEGPYNSNTTYYEKQIPEILYEEIQLRTYEPNKYYYREVNGNYRFETSEDYQEGRNYYEATWSDEPVSLHDAYKPNVYYYKPNENDFYLEKSENFDSSRKYYSPTKAATRYMYAPNTFYYFDEDDNPIRDDKEFDSNKNYYLFKDEVPIRVSLSNYEKNKYWKLVGDNYILQTKDTLTKADVVLNQEPIPFYELGNIQNPLNPFYKANTYYYKKGKDYILSAETNKNSEIDYYKIVTSVKLEDFYKPNTYYIYDTENQMYKKDKTDTITEGQTYYEKVEYYVMSDEDEIFTAGAIWNSNVLRVPATIKVGTRETYYEMEELEGFARDFNTIHGLILNLNYMLEAGNLNTRDESTVQGAINLIKDTIEKFDELTPGQFMIVNDLGQMSGANYTTAQEFNSKNEGNGNTTKIDSTENRWISIDVNEENKIITLQHNFTPVTNTTTASDNNSPESDTIDLYTPIVDNKGHVVGKNTETVTLPYGFKSVLTNGTSTSVSNLNNTTSDVKLVANNTQDLLTINPQNKWIRMANSQIANTLEIGHEVHSITTTAKTQTDLNNPALDTMTIQDTSYDEAGHVISNQSHEYILPYGYKTISVIPFNGTQTNIVADNTQDTLTQESLNKWIQLEADATNDKINIKHLENNVSQTTNSIDLDNSATFEIQKYTFDTAGHIASSVNTTYNLPDAVKTLGVSNLGAAAGSAAANLYNDTITLNASNEWINLDATGKIVNIKHKTSLNEITSQGESSPQYNFGSVFKVPTLTADMAGHITALSSYEVTLPKMSLITDSNSGNVLTSLELIEETGLLTQKSSNIGDLALTGYETGLLEETDTLNEGLKKLETRNIVIEGEIAYDSTTETFLTITETYPDGFDFSNTMILNVMFNFQNGWNSGNIYVNPSITCLESNIEMTLVKNENVDSSIIPSALGYRIALMKI